jgi:hypothetical protein
MDLPFFSHLASVGMERYFNVFQDYGVESVADIRFMGDADFTECGVKPFHRKKLLALAEASEIVAEPAVLSEHRFLFEPLFLPVDQEKARKDAEEKEYQRLQEEGQRLRAEERRTRERQEADERRAREELARFAVETSSSSVESESDEWEVVGRKKMEARQAEQTARDAAKAEKIRRAEEERIRRAEEEKARQAKVESERRRVEKARVKTLTVAPKALAPKALAPKATTPKKNKLKKKPSPPSNLCLMWKTKGRCTYLLAGKKCSFEHPEEWKGGK